MTCVSKSNHHNQGTSYNKDGVNMHSQLFLHYWILMAPRMRPRLVANTSRPLGPADLSSLPCTPSAAPCSSQPRGAGLPSVPTTGQDLAASAVSGSWS